LKLNLSDDPITADLLAESLRRTGSAVIAVNGTSMHPTLPMGYRVYLRPASAADLKVGEIAVFRGDRYLTIHRLVWKEPRETGGHLVFRGDYNRVRERVSSDAVVGRAVALEIPGPRRGAERVVTLEPDLLARFYRSAHVLARLLRPLARPRKPDTPPGPAERAARRLFVLIEGFLSLFLRERR
jgi:signal peptidase I